MSANAKSKKTLKQQITDLDDLLAWFDNSEIDLDKAAEQFAKGIALAKEIKDDLTKLENKITILKKRFDQESSC